MSEIAPSPAGVPVESGVAAQARGARARAAAALRAPLALLRFLIRRFLWLVVRFVRAAWRHPVISLLLILAIYGGSRAYQEYLVAPAPAPAAPRFDIAPPIPPADSVTRYLDAQQRFDAEGMWNVYSETTKSANLAQGSSLETLRSTEAALKSAGLRYGESVYVGGTKTNDGRAFYFYVTTLKDPSGATAEVYQVFYVDADGKILRVITPQLQ